MYVYILIVLMGLTQLLSTQISVSISLLTRCKSSKGGVYDPNSLNKGQSMGDQNSVEVNSGCQDAVSASGFGGVLSFDTQDSCTKDMSSVTIKANHGADSDTNQSITKSGCTKGPDWQATIVFWEVEQGEAQILDVQGRLKTIFKFLGKGFRPGTLDYKLYL